MAFLFAPCIFAPRMTYAQTVDYLYKNLPIFQRVGASAYKADLTNTVKLCAALGDPQLKFKSIHIAGTNGKGSSSHMLSAILQQAGYTTGLYTSPHLKAFTERIKINGAEIEQEFIVDFVKRIKPKIEEIHPSFFEITVAMAFDYFASQQVDIAVIEVGLGGRLDSTNVITPLLSLITNISFDHKDILGDTLPKIAFEKAGIIKPGVPVIISEYQEEVKDVFVRKAFELHSEITFASHQIDVRSGADSTCVVLKEGKILFENLRPELKGSFYQDKNIKGVILAAEKLNALGLNISEDDIRYGIEHTVELTGLKGRWQNLGEYPKIYCDTAHNAAGIAEVVKQIQQLPYKSLFIVLGMVKDKDISDVLRLLPGEAFYYFCQAKIPRALDAHQLADKAGEFGLRGIVIEDVQYAIHEAKRNAMRNDLIFIGGSTFVVAEIAEL